MAPCPEAGGSPVIVVWRSLGMAEQTVSRWNWMLVEMEGVQTRPMLAPARKPAVKP